MVVLSKGSDCGCWIRQSPHHPRAIPVRFWPFSYGDFASAMVPVPAPRKSVYPFGSPHLPLLLGLWLAQLVSMDVASNENAETRAPRAQLWSMHGWFPERRAGDVTPRPAGHRVLRSLELRLRRLYGVGVRIIAGGAKCVCSAKSAD